MPMAEPVGEMLPMGEFVPLLESRSENEELRVDERPRDSERESLEYEYEPVVVDPLTGEQPGERPRPTTTTASLGERKLPSGGDVDEACVAMRGTGTGTAPPGA